eukprot:GEMP01061291.1.p1 GENE.GEMP01061291.1~~GEMP01061291.1.p1  ORF type:complete len:237 (+),score=39.60 GEMP01061291.1:103-813(+)
MDRLIERPPADVKRVKLENGTADKPVLLASIVSNADAFKGDWPVRISFPADYPFSPPHCQFLEPVPFHPNVDFRNGGICADIFNDGTLWSPTYGIERLLLSLVSLLDCPNTDHGLNSEAIELLKSDPAAFTQRALEESRKRRAKFPVPVDEPAPQRPALKTKIEAEKDAAARAQGHSDAFERERQVAVEAALRHAEAGPVIPIDATHHASWSVMEYVLYVVVPIALGVLWLKNVQL